MTPRIAKKKKKNTQQPTTPSLGQVRKDMCTATNQQCRGQVIFAILLTLPQHLDIVEMYWLDQPVLKGQANSLYEITRMKCAKHSILEFLNVYLFHPECKECIFTGV